MAIKTYIFSCYFLKVNETCLSIQRKQTNIYRAHDNIISFSRKWQYWTPDVDHNDFECFSILTEFLQESETELDTETINDIKDHLAGLSESLTMYFPNLE